MHENWLLPSLWARLGEDFHGWSRNLRGHAEAFLLDKKNPDLARELLGALRALAIAGTNAGLPRRQEPEPMTAQDQFQARRSLTIGHEPSGFEPGCKCHERRAGVAGAIDTGILYRDDNIERLSQLPSDSVDLIYLDPPFFSNRVYEVIWGDEAEVRSFEDRWEGGIQHYIGWMRPRVEEMERVLSPSGSLYFHCDPHASHYLKVMLDDVFRQTLFRNEMIWKRTSAHSSARRAGPVHDVILFYTKSSDYTWNPTYQEYDQSYIEQFYTHIDEDGRRWTRSDLTGSGVRNGATGEVWRGIDITAKGRHWAHPPEALERLDAEGHIHWPKKQGGMPRLKKYLEDQPGVLLQDVWTDIRPLHNLAAERLGYPTQKPEELLERIIRSSSNAGDVVLDPFCGCGTSVAVAAKLDREWIGVDISPTAIQIMKRRLLKIGVDPLIVNAPETKADLKMLSPFEFQNWVIEAMSGSHSPKKVGDMGIDGFSFLTRDPIQVKQSEKVGRPAIDAFQTAVRRHGSDTGYMVAFSFSRGAFEEVARAKGHGLNIKLIRVSELLLQLKRPGDPRVDIGPQPANVEELPLGPTRKPKDLPTADELIESERARRAAAG